MFETFVNYCKEVYEEFKNQPISFEAFQARVKKLPEGTEIAASLNRTSRVIRVYEGELQYDYSDVIYFSECIAQTAKGRKVVYNHPLGPMLGGSGVCTSRESEIEAQFLQLCETLEIRLPGYPVKQNNPANDYFQIPA